MEEDAAMKEARLEEAKRNLAQGREKRRLALQKRKEESDKALVNAAISAMTPKLAPPIPQIQTPPGFSPGLANGNFLPSSIASNPLFTNPPPSAPIPPLTTTLNPFLTQQQRHPDSFEPPSPPPKRKREEERPKPILKKYEPPVDDMDVEEPEQNKKKVSFDLESSEGSELEESEIEEPPPKRKKGKRTIQLDAQGNRVYQFYEQRPDGSWGDDPLPPSLRHGPSLSNPIADPLPLSTGGPQDLYSKITYNLGKLGILGGSALVYFLLQYITSWGISKANGAIEKAIWKPTPPPPMSTNPEPRPEDGNSYNLSNHPPSVPTDEKKNPDVPYRLQ